MSGSVLQSGQNIVCKTGKICDHLYFNKNSKIHSRNVSSSGYELVSAPHQLRVLMRLVEDLTISNFQEIISNMQTLGKTMEDIANGYEGADVMKTLQGVSQSLMGISSNVDEVSVKLALLQDGFKNQDEILTLEQINSLVEDLDNTMLSLQSLITQLQNSTGDVTGIEELHVAISGILSEITGLVTQVVTLNSKLDEFNSDAIKVHFQYAVETYQTKVNTIVESLKELATLDDVSEKVNAILTVLVDLSGADLPDITDQFGDIDDFQLNLLQGYFRGIVIFGDENVFPISNSPVNGPSWTDYLAQRLFINEVSYFSDLSGTVDYTNNPRSLKYQVHNMFLSNQVTASDNIYVISTGSSDILAGGLNLVLIVARISENIDSLVLHGARIIIISGRFWRKNGESPDFENLLKVTCEQKTTEAVCVIYWGFEPDTTTLKTGFLLDSTETLYLSDVYNQCDILDTPYDSYGNQLDHLDYLLWDTDGNATTMCHNLAASAVFKELTDRRDTIRNAVKAL